METHEIDYELIGDDMQIVEIELDPEETVVAEAGAMNYLEEDIEFEAKMGDGSKPRQGMLGKLFDAGKRVLTGESIFMSHFTNHGVFKKRSHLPLLTRERLFVWILKTFREKFFVKKTHFFALP